MMKFDEAMQIVFELAKQNALEVDDDGCAVDPETADECCRQQEALDEVAQWLGVYRS